MQHSDECTYSTLRALSEQFFGTHTENKWLFHRVEVPRHGEFDFGAGLSKKEGSFFEKKNTLIGHRSIFLQSVCAKITSFRTIAVERCSAQKLHSSAIALLQIFDLVFVGSRVAVTSQHTIFTENFLFIHNVLK